MLLHALGQRSIGQQIVNATIGYRFDRSLGGEGGTLSDLFEPGDGFRNALGVDVAYIEANSGIVIRFPRAIRAREHSGAFWLGERHLIA
jgi:hypothetical protein